MALRVDAQRNLERVLDAATELFAASGPDVSVDEIAERAGVGHATVFRRFPTKDDLILAVVGRHVDRLCELAREALAEEDPGPAFVGLVHRIAELNMSSPGLHQCVVHCVEKPGGAELQRLFVEVVDRAQRAGAVRADVRAADVPLLVRGALLSAPPGQWRRYLDVILSGLQALHAEPAAVDRQVDAVDGGVLEQEP
jgi:AcrR family transcriptional regulator